LTYDIYQWEEIMPWNILFVQIITTFTSFFRRKIDSFGLFY
jgi:hypothetical protein